jgi:hypothetical protein
MRCFCGLHTGCEIIYSPGQVGEIQLEMGFKISNDLTINFVYFAFTFIYI